MGCRARLAEHPPPGGGRWTRWAGTPGSPRPWIEAARPEHPALIDERHRLDELFGIVNVPSGVWIDETGV